MVKEISTYDPDLCDFCCFGDSIPFPSNESASISDGELFNKIALEEFYDFQRSGYSQLRNDPHANLLMKPQIAFGKSSEIGSTQPQFTLDEETKKEVLEIAGLSKDETVALLELQKALATKAIQTNKWVPNTDHSPLFRLYNVKHSNFTIKMFINTSQGWNNETTWIEVELQPPQPGGEVYGRIRIKSFHKDLAAQELLRRWNGKLSSNLMDEVRQEYNFWKYFHKKYSLNSKDAIQGRLVLELIDDNRRHQYALGLAFNIKPGKDRKEYQERLLKETLVAHLMATNSPKLAEIAPFLHVGTSIVKGANKRSDDMLIMNF